MPLQPFSKDDFLDLWRRVLPGSYTQPIETEGDGIELRRSHALRTAQPHGGALADGQRDAAQAIGNLRQLEDDKENPFTLPCWISDQKRAAAGTTGGSPGAAKATPSLTAPVALLWPSLVSGVPA